MSHPLYDDSTSKMLWADDENMGSVEDHDGLWKAYYWGRDKVEYLGTYKRRSDAVLVVNAEYLKHKCSEAEKT